MQKKTAELTLRTTESDRKRKTLSVLLRAIERGVQNSASKRRLDSK
ncbi:hypothetical protein LEP1GSC005_1911 [Leptospira santarosai str. ST188]|nr:hypothetical protein LEP1GSC005_1911 [Leptospira santarosai str. ST188]